MDENPIANQGVISRIAATYALAAVFEKHLKLDESLDRIFSKYRMNDADKRLVHAICGFIFRNITTIDGILHRVMDRKRDPSPKLLHQLLRVGVAQLLYMDVAPHAAVHATVSAVGSLHLGRQKGLVNAVLRSVQRQKDELMAMPTDTMTMLPEWVVSRWKAVYGESETRSLITAMQQEAPLDLSIKDADASLQWGQTLGGETLCSGSVRVHHAVGHIVSWPGFSDGAWWVQDVAASMPINMLGDVAKKSVLDMCAAPGGKTMQLAARGASVTALDLSASRMHRITENLARTKLDQSVKTVVADACTWCTDDRFDIVVLDAPCTSTGTLRRHPELPWIIDKNQLEKTTASQRDLLRRASELLRPDGILLYCTCSLEPEEGENQVESFLAQHNDFKEITDIPAVVQPFLKRGLKGIGWRSFPTHLADKGGMDGFFLAMLQKR